MQERHKKAPVGFIDMWSAKNLIWLRMFPSGLSPWLIAAAQENIAEATGQSRATPAKKIELSAYVQPEHLLGEAIKNASLKMFIYSEHSRRTFPLDAANAYEVLSRMGFFQMSTTTIAFAFYDFCPIQMLDGLELGDFGATTLENFALCVRERSLDQWLAITAHDQRWPLDAEPRRRRGRPDRVSVVKPLLKALIDHGRWTQGKGLKDLSRLINAKLPGEEVDRETIKRALVQLYEETGQLEYRYVSRRRTPRAPRRG